MNLGPTELIICGIVLVVMAAIVVIIVVISKRVTRVNSSITKNAEFGPIGNPDPTLGKSVFRAKLRQNLTEHFSEDELRTLCFDMGLDYESLAAEGKAGQVRELVALVERQNSMARLIEQCRLLRPNVQWEDAPEVASEHDGAAL